MDQSIKEGDLYKCITAFGKTFEVRYGYYSETERHSPFHEVIPIYPNFSETPLHTDEGRPFVTQMQDICEHYAGAPEGDDCYSCPHYLHGDELLGICLCENNKRSQAG